MNGFRICKVFYVHDDDEAPTGEGDVTSARRVAEAWSHAVASGDAEAAIRLSSPEIVYTVVHLMRYEGHEGVRDIVEDYARLSGFVTQSVLAAVEQDGVVALQRHEKYTLPDGVIDVPCCAFVEVENGRVTRWADYKNMQVLDNVTGL